MPNQAVEMLQFLNFKLLKMINDFGGGGHKPKNVF